MLSFEVKCGVTIAILAASMSVSDLFAGKYGDDEIIGTNEKSAAYMWYQSKSIKQSLSEGQHDLLQSLLKNGAIELKAQAGIENQLQEISKKISKYEKEKNEILQGSEAVGKENWAQEKEGAMGQIVGALEIQNNLIKLGKAGDRFDFASLFYQLSLVLGAISLVLKSEKAQKFFYSAMLTIGGIAISWSVAAFLVLA